MIIIKVLRSGNDHTLILNLPGVQCFVSSDRACIKRDYSMEDWVPPSRLPFLVFFLKNEMYVYNSQAREPVILLDRLSFKGFLCSDMLPFQSCLGGHPSWWLSGSAYYGICGVKEKKENWLSWWANCDWDTCWALTTLSVSNQKSVNFQIYIWKWTKAYSHRKKNPVI